APASRVANRSSATSRAAAPTFVVCLPHSIPTGQCVAAIKWRKVVFITFQRLAVPGDAPRGARLPAPATSVLQLADDRALRHGVTLLHGQAGDGAVLVRVDRVLHLHRFQHGDHVPGLDLIPFRDRHLDQGALHRGGHRVAGRGSRLLAGRPLARLGLGRRGSALAAVRPGPRVGPRTPAAPTPPPPSGPGAPRRRASRVAGPAPATSRRDAGPRPRPPTPRRPPDQPPPRPTPPMGFRPW